MMKERQTAGQYKLLAGFILVWITINIVQASLTGVYPDEAYYWIFSRDLQWGYFDHPPVVALSIRLGELIGHGSLFTRIGTVLLSGGSIFFLYKALPVAFTNIRIFITCFVSVAIFHIYGFIATPDGPLFFFTTVFFYAYKKYLHADNLKSCFLLSVSIVGMLYSKYHGVLPLFFVFLSNSKLVSKRSAWAVVAVVIVALLPHVYWQYLHEWPTPKYHLYDRVASAYHISKTTNYVLGQLLVWGLLTAIPAFYLIYRNSSKDLYLKANGYTLYGVLIFFFLFSFKSSIEPHWTLVAGPSFIILLVSAFPKASQRMKTIFTRLAIANVILMLLVRLLLFIPIPPIIRAVHLKALFYGKTWADSIHKYAGSTPVVFIDSYALPSLYAYYHPEVQSTSVNTINYRKNHFTISGDELKVHNKKTFVQVARKIDHADLDVTTPYTNTYLHLVDSFKAINALKVRWSNKIKKGIPGQQVEGIVSIVNRSGELLLFAPGLKLNYSFFETRKERVTSPDLLLSETQFLPNQPITAKIPLRLPSQPGNYRLVFSLKYFPFEGTLASDYFDVRVR